MTRPKTIHEICAPCAEARGGRIPEGHLSTMYLAICDVCGETAVCTQPRDFRPRPDRPGATEKP